MKNMNSYNGIMQWKKKRNCKLTWNPTYSPIFALLIVEWRNRHIKGPTLTRGLIIDPLKKLVRFYQTMTETEIKQMQEKINVGILLPESVWLRKPRQRTVVTEQTHVLRGKEYYSTKNGVIYTIYLKRLRAGRKNAVFLWLQN